MALNLLPPMRFRFLDAEDQAAYGDGWWIWDEAAVARLRGRALIAIEDAIDLPVRAVIGLGHADYTIGNMATMWIALHLAGHEVGWTEFNPIPLATEWELAPKEPAPGPLDDGGSGGGQPTEASGSSIEPTTESATS